jgi:hypothetical protein
MFLLLFRDVCLLFYEIPASPAESKVSRFQSFKDFTISNFQGLPRAPK